MTPREFLESRYREKHAVKMALVESIREQLAHLYCYKLEARYHYDHWEDAQG